jgi:hypothetical protein
MCKHCQKIFYTRPSEKRNFCSNECSASNKKNRVWLKCKVCGKDYEVLSSKSKVSKFCSLECLQKEQQSKHINKICEFCGKQFDVVSSEADTKFCSKKCASENMSHTLESMQAIAAERNGICLSEKYVNARTPLLWQCSEGHRWKAAPDGILRGSWCRFCAGQEKTIEDMHKIALERGGKCLSEKYISARSKLEWQCAQGHEFKATPDHMIRGRWCPNCSSGLGERICRAFFEQLFKTKFPKSYPPWLLNKTGRRLELDGYSKELKLAFEHQGKHHYKLVEYFQRTQSRLYEQIERDELKKHLCKKCGVSLIIVPEIPTLLPIDEVKDHMKMECIRNGVVLPSTFDDTPINLIEAYSTAKTKMALEELKFIARERGGRCLSHVYVNITTKLPWECKKKHQWKATPGSIKQGSWCPYCAGRHKTILDMIKLAESRGGKCLSNVYVNASTKLLWQCPNGHKWLAIPDSIRRGTWCPTCAKIAKKN